LYPVGFLLISLQSYAGLKEKNVIGTWKFKVETDQGDITGKLIFEKKEGALVGEVYTDEGETIPMSKVEIRDNDILYFEVDTGYETIEISVTVKKNTFEGMAGNEQGSFPMTGEKVE
jgi:hypothetical protein